MGVPPAGGRGTSLARYPRGDRHVRPPQTRPVRHRPADRRGTALMAARRRDRTAHPGGVHPRRRAAGGLPARVLAGARQTGAVRDLGAPVALQRGYVPPMDLGGEQVVLRPSLCPHHALIYRSRSHRYRELPLRMAGGVRCVQRHPSCVPNHPECPCVGGGGATIGVPATHGCIRGRTRPTGPCFLRDCRGWRHAVNLRLIAQFAQGGGHKKDEGEGDGHPGQPWTPTDEPTPDGGQPDGGGDHRK